MEYLHFSELGFFVSTLTKERWFDVAHHKLLEGSSLGVFERTPGKLFFKQRP
jgi:hypothetical protein